MQVISDGVSSLLSDPFTMLRDNYTRSVEVTTDLAHAKRFLERFGGDDDFQRGVLDGSLSLSDAALTCGCEIDVSTLRPVFDPSFVKYRKNASLSEWRLTHLWDDHLKSSLKARNALLLSGDSGGNNPNFDKWRARNINRSSLQLGISSSGIVHPPVAFELSSGCTVGCWFCGVSAEKFKGHATLENGGASEWRETLQAVKSIVGDGIRCGFCYWATDPLDNPDYIGFLRIFEEVTGVTPQTTTAIPLRNPDLTRDVIKIWEENRYTPNRFSIMSKRTLLKVHEEFTPEELYGVEIVMQTNSSGGVYKFLSGRTFSKETARQRAKNERSQEGTISCVTGYLINIFEKTVKLISPTIPSEKNPNGYVTYMEKHYKNPADLMNILNLSVKTHMKDTLCAFDPAFFTEDGIYDDSKEKARIRFRSVSFEDEDLRVVGSAMEKGVNIPIDIVREAHKTGVNPIRTVLALERLFSAGVIWQHAT